MTRDKADKSTIELNEWGIPDWRRRDAYGEVEAWSDDRWRWEFMRRRRDLREFFDYWAPSVLQDKLRRNEGLTLDQPGFTVVGREEDAGKAVGIFGYSGIPNPRIGDQPWIAITPVAHINNKLRYHNPRLLMPADDPYNAPDPKKERIRYNINLKPREYAIRFDLDLPLAPQIKEAAEVLQRNQKRIHGKRLTSSKQYKAKWLSYLRVLDARAARVSYKKITDILYADGTIEARKGPDGIMGAPPPQAARDLKDHAEALRDKL